MICCTCISAYVVFRLACTGGGHSLQWSVPGHQLSTHLQVHVHVHGTDPAEATPTKARCALNRKTGRTGSIYEYNCIKDQRKSLKDPNEPSCYFTACNQPDLPTESFQTLKLDRGRPFFAVHTVSVRRKEHCNIVGTISTT